LHAENARIRKRAVFYRNVAAALVLFIAGAAYFNLQNWDFNNNEDQTSDLIEFNYSDLVSFSATKEAEMPEPNADSNYRSSTTLKNSAYGTKGSEINAADISEGNDFRGMNNSSVSTLSLDETGSKTTTNEFSIATVVPEDVRSKGEQEGSMKGGFTANDVYFASLEPVSPNINGDVLMVEGDIKQVSYFAVSELEKQKQKKNNDAFNMIAALNVGSGSFNPNASISDIPQTNASTLNTNAYSYAGRGEVVNDVSKNSAELAKVQELSSSPIRSNLSLTIGANFGVQLSERLTIRSGLQYGNYRSYTETSAVLRDYNNSELYPYHVASSAFNATEGKVLNVTSEYNLYNDFKLLSVPLTVAYKIIDRKFGLALVGGVTADIFLENTLKGGSEQVNEVTFDSSDETPYENLFASGLAGVEFSYNLSNHYAISVMPSFKKSFTNFTKSDAVFTSTPAFASLSMSLNYNF
jgi:hypothetical protein